MNIAVMEKNLKRTKLIIIFDLITIPLFLILMLAIALPAIIGAATGSYEATIFAAVSTTILFIVLIVGLLVLGVLLLVYKILLTIYAFEFEEKIYGILMIVGFFVGLVGLVVLFLFYFYLKKKIEEEKLKEIKPDTPVIDSNVIE